MPSVRDRKSGDGGKVLTIQSVARASRVLLSVAAATPRPVSATEVSTEFDLTLPTAYHLLTTLVEEGLLAKDQDRRYVLGPKAAVIADAVARDANVSEAHLSLLRRLAEQSGETAYLSAWRRGEIRVLATIEGAHAVRVGDIGTGFFGDVHARATGKLLLAYAREDVRRAVLAERPLPALTPHTITDSAKLEAELDQVRVAGFAYDWEEYALGVACVSAPIRDGDTVVAALTLSAPVERFKERKTQYTRIVVEIAGTA